MYKLADGQVHQLSAAEVTLHKCTTGGKLGHRQILAVHGVTLAIDDSGQCVIADNFA